MAKKTRSLPNEDKVVVEATTIDKRSLIVGHKSAQLGERHMEGFGEDFCKDVHEAYGLIVSQLLGILFLG